jgi:Dual specificity phosphatase, catalytic domain
MRFAVVFGILGIVLAVMAQWLAEDAIGAGWLLVAGEAYFACCFLTLAALYGLRHAGLPVENAFRHPVSSRVIRSVVFPYLVVAGITVHLSRWIGREDMMNRVEAGLYVGRLPFPADRALLADAGVTAVLNLCWEFPSLSGEWQTACLPVLDGSPPSERQFLEALDRVGRWRAEGRTVLIHCAQGHGRSATIAAAALCRLGFASDAEEAIARIRTARPRVRPSRAQRTALEQFLARDIH